jgi:hypothetical protein
VKLVHTHLSRSPAPLHTLIEQNVFKRIGRYTGIERILRLAFTNNQGSKLPNAIKELDSTCASIKPITKYCKEAYAQGNQVMEMCTFAFLLWLV